MLLSWNCFWKITEMKILCYFIFRLYRKVPYPLLRCAGFLRDYPVSSFRMIGKLSWASAYWTLCETSHCCVSFELNRLSSINMIIFFILNMEHCSILIPKMWVHIFHYEKHLVAKCTSIKANITISLRVHFSVTTCFH